jgi:hypothetical protein
MDALERSNHVPVNVPPNVPTERSVGSRGVLIVFGTHSLTEYVQNVLNNLGTLV